MQPTLNPRVRSVAWEVWRIHVAIATAPPRRLGFEMQRARRHLEALIAEFLRSCRPHRIVSAHLQN